MTSFVIAIILIFIGSMMIEHCESIKIGKCSFVIFTIITGFLAIVGGFFTLMVEAANLLPGILL